MNNLTNEWILMVVLRKTFRPYGVLLQEFESYSVEVSC